MDSYGPAICIIARTLRKPVVDRRLMLELVEVEQYGAQPRVPLDMPQEAGQRGR